MMGCNKYCPSRGHQYYLHWEPQEVFSSPVEPFHLLPPNGSPLCTIHIQTPPWTSTWQHLPMHKVVEILSTWEQKNRKKKDKQIKAFYWVPWSNYWHINHWLRAENFLPLERGKGLSPHTYTQKVLIPTT